MAAATTTELRDAARSFTGLWWMFLAAGIAWIIVAFAVLTISPTTPTLVGLLTGIVLLLAGVSELVSAAFTDSWRWLRISLGILVVVAGILALLSPMQTFGILSLLIGWYLLFKGFADMIVSIAERDVLPAWGLLLGLGIIETLLGIWAIGYPSRSAWLLVMWVGFAALARGVAELILAFTLREADRELA